MSVTLEHGRLLHTAHGLEATQVAATVGTMRRRGTRRENARFNTTRRVYNFNWLQQAMLPAAYRPPEGSAMVNSKRKAAFPFEALVCGLNAAPQHRSV